MKFTKKIEGHSWFPDFVLESGDKVLCISDPRYNYPEFYVGNWYTVDKADQYRFTIIGVDFLQINNKCEYAGCYFLPLPILRRMKLRKINAVQSR